MTELQKERKEKNKNERSEKIRLLYEESGLSYTELAKVTGCNVNTLSCYITGKRTPPKAVLTDIEKKVRNYFCKGNEYIDRKACQKIFSDKISQIILGQATKFGLNEPDELYKLIMKAYNTLPVRTTKEIVQNHIQK